MAKLTYMNKKEIIRLYDEERYGYSRIASLFHVSPSLIERIVRKYHLHGESVLKKQKNKIFSPSLKFEIISRAMNGESKTALAIEYKTQDSQIYIWLKKYKKFGYNGLINKPKGRPPIMKKDKKTIDPNDKDAVIKQKDEEILELKAEVEALKKLRALVLQRNKQQIKKKQQ